jgi:hypothetical protein
VKHARYYWLLLAESHLTRRLFTGMLQKITTLPVPTGIGVVGRGHTPWMRPVRQGAVCEESASKTVDAARRAVEGRKFGHVWLPGVGRDRETGLGVDARAPKG